MYKPRDKKSFFYSTYSIFFLLLEFKDERFLIQREDQPMFFNLKNEG